MTLHLLPRDTIRSIEKSPTNIGGWWICKADGNDITYGCVTANLHQPYASIHETALRLVDSGVTIKHACTSAYHSFRLKGNSVNRAYKSTHRVCRLQPS